MAFQPCPGVAEFDMVWSESGNIMENVIHVQHTDLSSWSTTNIANMLTTLNTWITGSLIGHMVSAYTLDHLKGVDLTSSPGNEGTGFGGTGGTMTGTPLPANVTLAIKFNSGTSGRGRNGRVFAIGLAKEKQTADRYDQTETTALNTAWAGLLTTINAVTNCQMVILSRYHGTDPTTHKPVKRASGVGVPIISVGATDNVLDSQRRRLIGHNRHRR